MKNLQKTTAILCTAAALAGAFGITSMPPATAAAGEPETVMPMFTAITDYYSNLSISGGIAYCSARTKVQSGYIAGVIIELQYKNGSSWITADSRSGTAWDMVSVSQNWYINSSYEYRLVTQHYAYDSSWNVVDSLVTYSY